MPRQTLDRILTSIGAVMTLLLLIAGGLLMWGYSFANSNVHDQLSQQKIFFPPKGSEALASPKIGPYLNKYAGQQLTSGDQAKAYADHFIAVHLQGIGGGKTYSQLSTQAMQSPNDTTMQQKVQTMFRGETLRGLLLNAYAFWKLGQLALIAAICSFVLAGIMLVLTVLGYMHLRRIESAGGAYADEAEQARLRT